jgi:hypothetical protein
MHGRTAHHACACQVWACMSGMEHVGYGRACQVWTCMSGMDVHVRYGRYELLVFLIQNSCDVATTSFLVAPFPLRVDIIR